MAELINKWDVVNKLIQLENNYQFYKEQWDADVLYRRICELEIGIGKTPAIAIDNNVGHKWIPVTERLPDAWVDVLSCDRNKNLTVDCVDKKGKWYSEYTDLEEVTHWMPLPEPPKGE
jgi:hypothetical protein